MCLRGDRHADRRLDHPAGVVLRRRGHEAEHQEVAVHSLGVFPFAPASITSDRSRGRSATCSPLRGSASIADATSPDAKIERDARPRMPMDRPSSRGCEGSSTVVPSRSMRIRRSTRPSRRSLLERGGGGRPPMIRSTSRRSSATIASIMAAEAAVDPLPTILEAASRRLSAADRGPDRARADQSPPWSISGLRSTEQKMIRSAARVLLEPMRSSAVITPATVGPAPTRRRRGPGVQLALELHGTADRLLPDRPGRPMACRSRSSSSDDREDMTCLRRGPLVRTRHPNLADNRGPVPWPATRS